MGIKMLEGDCLAIVETQSVDEFRDKLVRYAQNLGFRIGASMWVVDKLQGPPDFIRVNNIPAVLTDRVLDTSIQIRDPVMQHCKRSALPIIWDRDTYATDSTIELWEEQASYGFCTGVATAMHLPRGRHFMIGVSHDQPLNKSPEEITRVVADLQLFAVHAMDAASRLLDPPAAASDQPRLTIREREALNWTMEGKTAWEVGTILGISERTAISYLQSAMQKLNCISKHQAVLKALRLGLIG
jgi:DNA-binding CsgD family transcriptional regulator